MIKTLLASLLFLLPACIIVADGNCKDDFDCRRDRICDHGDCIDPRDLYMQCDEIMHGCTCASTAWVRSELVADDNCVSGMTVVGECTGCCDYGQYGQCVSLPWTRVCMCDMP